MAVSNIRPPIKFIHFARGAPHVRALKLSVGNSLDLRVVRDVYRRRDHGVVHSVIEWCVVHLDCGYPSRLILGNENVVW